MLCLSEVRYLLHMMLMIQMVLIFLQVTFPQPLLRVQPHCDAWTTEIYTNHYTDFINEYNLLAIFAFELFMALSFLIYLLRYFQLILLMNLGIRPCLIIAKLEGRCPHQVWDWMYCINRYKAGYLFKGCYFGAFMGNSKITKIKCL